jgi:CheY-like chemotaxis protein
MNGTELSRRIREMRPQLPIVLVTGYRDDTTRDKSIAGGLSTVLMKPYVGADLVRAVRNALHRARRSTP